MLIFFFVFFKHILIPFCNYLVAVFHSWKAFQVMKCYSLCLSVCFVFLGNSSWTVRNICGFHAACSGDKYLFKCAAPLYETLSVCLSIRNVCLSVYACLNIILLIFFFVFFKHILIPFCNYLVAVFHPWKAFQVKKCYSICLICLPW